MSQSAPARARSAFARIGDVLTLIACRPRLLLTALLGVIVTSATAYALLEDKGPVESLWWVIVTGSTVGYGDFYPSTTAGRAVGAFLIICMFVLALCLGAQLTARLIPDPHIFTDEEQRRVFAALDRIEAHLDRECPNCGAQVSATTRANGAGHPDEAGYRRDAVGGTP